MKTIFIVLQYPYDLLVAIQIREDNTWRNYHLIDAEYGRDDICRIEESNMFQEVPLKAIPLGIKEIVEWPRYEERFLKAYIHKP